jgi:hypothetical protein
METTRPLARAGYLLAALMVVLPIFDAITRLIPFHMSDERWRFQTFGNLSNVPLVPLFGLFLAMAFTWLAGDTRVRRSIGALSVVLALAIAGITIVFITDYFGVRGQIPPRFQHVAALASVAAVIKEILAILVLALLALAAFLDRKMPVSNKSSATANR